MKIVGVDNHASETVADHLWMEGIPDTTDCRALAQCVCDRLNKRLGEGDGHGLFYLIKSDDYQLSRGMEDLV